MLVRTLAAFVAAVFATVVPALAELHIVTQNGLIFGNQTQPYGVCETLDYGRSTNMTKLECRYDGTVLFVDRMNPLYRVQKSCNVHVWQAGSKWKAQVIHNKNTACGLAWAHGALYVSQRPRQ